MGSEGFESIPVVEIELRGLKEKLVSAVALRHRDIQAEVEKGVDRALAQFSIAEVAAQGATRILKENIDRTMKAYFGWGEGSQIIEEAVKSALREVLKHIGEKEEPKGGE